MYNNREHICNDVESSFYQHKFGMIAILLKRESHKRGLQAKQMQAKVVFPPHHIIIYSIYQQNNSK